MCHCARPLALQLVGIVTAVVVLVLIILVVLATTVVLVTAVVLVLVVVVVAKRTTTASPMKGLENGNDLGSSPSRPRHCCVQPCAQAPTNSK